jgi:hypothetical protein
MNVLSRLKEKVSEYIDVYVKLFKINFIGRTANLLGYFMFAVISLLIVFCIVLFSGFGLVEVFMGAGATKLVSFFLTVGVYLLLLSVVFACRKKLVRFFASAIIRVLTEGDEENEKNG